MASPNSSVKSSSSTSSIEDDDTFCSTPCLRDANCNCKICQASFNATLDLLPLSAQRPSKPSPPETPLFFDPSTVSTPTSHLEVSPPVKSPVVRTDLKLKLNRKKKTGFGYGLMTVKCVLVVLCLNLIGNLLNLGFEFVSSRVMRTELSPEIVRKLGEKSLGFRDVKEQLGFLNSELQNVLGATDARFEIPNWEIVEDGLILRSRCQLYKSGMEEVSVWGWPLQTSGLVSTDFGSRSFTVLSGRVTEWLNGGSNGLIRTANTSWEQGKWSASVWRLDENTWILEYKRSFVFEDTRPFSSAMEFLRFKMMRSLQWMKQLWQFPNANHLAPT
ncbi:putative ERG2/sigma1 receptor [Helianthus annuus]|nr:putative ERG2/sigma1 receptor [Helianthus annuus]